MAWVKSGTTTLTDQWTRDNNVTFTSKKLLFGIAHIAGFQTGATAGNSRIRFNNDSGTDYSRRESVDGGTDTTATSGDIITFAQYGGGVHPHDEFGFYFVVNVPNEEKLMMGWNVGRNTAGATNAPHRFESAGKYVPSPEADITQSMVRSGTAEGQGKDSNHTVFGSD